LKTKEKKKKPQRNILSFLFLFVGCGGCASTSTKALKSSAKPT